VADDTFHSAGEDYRITVNPGPSDGRSHPAILLVHGNFGLAEPYGTQIRDFARDLAGLGYVTAVPHYYTDDEPHLTDSTPHVRTLADALTAVSGRPDVDADRVGLIGFSLGATTAMAYIAENPTAHVKALADFFGFLTPDIRAAVVRFPPTIIFHNKLDKIVPVENSLDLDRLLPATVEHELVPPYEEHWQVVNHAFKPGGAADVDSRTRATKWFSTHVPPGGR